MKRKYTSPLARRRREGLTLVEIMIVMAILGVLMAVLGGNLLGVWESSNVDTTRLTIQKVEQGLQMYAARHRGKYPSTSEGLQVASALLPGGQVPADAWGNALIYVSPSSDGARPYELISLGKDGAEGGDGFDADIRSGQGEEGA